MTTFETLQKMNEKLTLKVEENTMLLSQLLEKIRKLEKEDKPKKPKKRKKKSGYQIFLGESKNVEIPKEFAWNKKGKKMAYIASLWKVKTTKQKKNYSEKAEEINKEEINKLIEKEKNEIVNIEEQTKKSEIVIKKSEIVTKKSESESDFSDSSSSEDEDSLYKFKNICKTLKITVIYKEGIQNLDNYKFKTLKDYQKILKYLNIHIDDNITTMKMGKKKNYFKKKIKEFFN